MGTTPAWFVEQLTASVKDKRDAGAGMTEIAYHCHLSAQMLYSYLRGDGEPKIDTYNRMAHYFGWNPTLAPLSDSQPSPTIREDD